MKNRPLFFVLVWLVAGACSSHQYSTTRMLNRDFAQYRTYGWLSPVDSLSKNYYSNDIAQANIMETANQELQARGLTYSKENPDILFRYIAIVNNKSREIYGHSPYMYSGSSWRWGYWGYYNPWMWGGFRSAGPVGRERFRIGHIILEARDRKTNTVVWQARGSGEVRSPEQAINALPKVVSKIMEAYPVHLPASR